MCAIFGLGILNGSKFVNNVRFGTILEKMFLSLEHRGRRASGIAFISPKKIRVLKKDIRPKLFVNSDSYQQAVRAYGDVSKDTGPIMVLGHCRLTTQGSEKRNVNNHPIITDNVVGIHNGHIRNDDALFKSFEQKQPDFVRAGQVDSEIIFRILDYYITQRKMNVKTAIIRTSRQLQGAYACAFVHRKNPYVLWLFRESNPTIVRLYTKEGIILFASTDEAIRDAAQAAKLDGTFVDFYMQQKEAIGLNFFNNKITRMSITTTDTDNNTLSKMDNSAGVDKDTIRNMLG